MAVADLAHPRQVRSFPVSGQIASEVSFAASTKGDQLLAWKTCSRAGACSVREVVRRAGARFSGPGRLGPIEATEAPAAALSASGEGLIGWIARGHVLTADLRPKGMQFGSAHTVSSAGDATDLALQFAPTGTAMAIWSEGVLAPEVVGAVYRGS